MLTLGAGATLACPVDKARAPIGSCSARARTRSVSSARSIGASFEQLETEGRAAEQIDTIASFYMPSNTVEDDGHCRYDDADPDGSAAANTLDVRGTLAGNVDLGDGDDRLVIAGLNSVTGTRTGGAGTDTLDFRTAGTYATPVSWDGQGFDSFEALNT